MPTVETLALTCLALLALGYVLLGLLTLIPRYRGFAREAWPIMLTETLIVGAAAGAIWLGGPVLVAALLALVARCAYEAAAVARPRHPGARLTPVTLAAAAAALAPVLSALPILATIAVAALLLAIGIFTKHYGILRDNPDARLLAELASFPLAPLLLFAAAGMQGGHGAWLLVAFIFVETFDSYALGGGRLFGRTPAFPRLSPRKTVEGLAFGAAALLLTAALAAPVLGAPPGAGMAVALLAGALTVAGDLAASALKRRSGVKDFPAVLPHQGGLLDIADAWIAAGAGLVALGALSGAG